MITFQNVLVFGLGAVFGVPLWYMFLGAVEVLLRRWDRKMLKPYHTGHLRNPVYGTPGMPVEKTRAPFNARNPAYRIKSDRPEQ